MDITDVVYGKIHLPSDVVAIVETPQFCRLKCLKQLGFLHLDNSIEHKHTRYHHCIGTYHAATLMLDALEKNTPWLSENNNEIKPLYRQAVQIAALLHDIGHGPFSHTWEKVAINYEHEKIGFACVDAIFETIDQRLFPELRKNQNEGIRLIKALIQGKMRKLKTFQLELPSRFQFIFGIVSNELNQLDVDKWDYLKRDYYYLNSTCNPSMDFDDVFLKARVSTCGQFIEYRYQDYAKVYNLFAARWHFHKDCYQLPTNLIKEDIFRYAICDIQPKINNMSITKINAECNRQEFVQLTDANVLKMITSHSLYDFLSDETKFQLVNVEQFKANEDFSIKSYIPNITSFINMDNLKFYGATEDMPNVIDQTYNIRRLIQFYCNESTQTIEYSVVSE